MANKSLKYFMRKEMVEEQVVEVPGPATITDEKGEPVILSIKRINRARIDKIYDMYKSTSVAMDKKTKKPYISDGKIVMKETKDYNKALRHIVTEALVYPDLHDEEMMNFYNCVDVTEMPRVMFTSDEYMDIVEKVQKVLGLISDEAEGEEDEEDLEEAKN